MAADVVVAVGIGRKCMLGSNEAPGNPPIPMPIPIPMSMPIVACGGGSMLFGSPNGGSIMCDRDGGMFGGMLMLALVLDMFGGSGMLGSGMLGGGMLGGGGNGSPIAWNIWASTPGGSRCGGNGKPSAPRNGGIGSPFSLKNDNGGRGGRSGSGGKPTPTPTGICGGMGSGDCMPATMVLPPVVVVVVVAFVGVGVVPPWVELLAGEPACPPTSTGVGRRIISDDDDDGHSAECACGCPFEAELFTSGDGDGGDDDEKGRLSCSSSGDRFFGRCVPSSPSPSRDAFVFPWCWCCCWWNGAMETCIGGGTSFSCVVAFAGG